MRKYFFALMLLLAVFIGIIYGGLQYSLLKMATELSISKSAMGSMVSVFFAAVTAAPLLTGRIADHKGKKTVILMTLFILAAGSAVCMSSHIAPMLFAGIAAAGFGTGAVESAVTAAVADFDIQKSGQNVNILHGVLGLGCFAAPLALDFVSTAFGYGWRFLYVVCALGALLCAILIVPTTFPKDSSKTPETGLAEEPNAIRNVLHDKTAMVLVIGIFIYMFMENGVTYFTDSFFSLDLGRSDLSAFALAAFWLAMAFMRFVSAALYRKETQILILGFGLSTLLLAFLFLLHQVYVVMASYAFIGLCFAPLWTFMTGSLNRRFPGNTGMISGIVLGVGGIGGMISPYVMGLCADAWNVAGGFLIIALMSAAGCILISLTSLEAKEKTHTTM